MARLEDYLPKTQEGTDELDNEITAAVVQTEERKAEATATIPERFQGKSAEQIAESYTNLEKKFSQQGNDLGEMRRTVDELMRQSVAQTSTAATTEAKPEEPLTVDELYENPEAAIAKVLEKRIQPHLEAQQAHAAQAHSAQAEAKLDASYDGWRDEVQTEGFQSFVEGSAYRQRMAQAVREHQDFDAANDLLAQYYDTVKKSPEAQRIQENQRQEDLSAAALTTGGAAYEAPTEKYSRNALMDLRIQANRGDQKAERWLKAHNSAIQTAYAEGRIVD